MFSLTGINFKRMDFINTGLWQIFNKLNPYEPSVPFIEQRQTVLIPVQGVHCLLTDFLIKQKDHQPQELEV